MTSDEVLAWKFGAEKTKRYRAFVSGVVASPSFLLAGAKPNYSKASDLSLKALVLMSRVGAKSENGRVRSLFRVTNWEHADVAVVTGSAVVILGCFILKPEAVERRVRRVFRSTLRQDEKAGGSVERVVFST